MASTHDVAASAQARAARALELHRGGRLAEAVAAYREALALAPQLPELHFNLGTTLHALGRLDDAIACYHAAIARAPTLAVAHDNLGNALVAKGDHDAAIASYKRALHAAPDHLPARYNLGAALQRCGRSREAIAHYRQVVARVPTAAAAHCNLALALMDTGSVDEAVGAFEAAAALRPNDAGIRGNLAQAHLARGDVDRAIACLEAAIALAPGDAALYNNLGNARDLAGDSAGAVASYRKALALDDSVELRANFGRAIAVSPSLDVDPALRVLLTRALTEAWTRPADLARICACAIDADASVDTLARDPLLIALLRSAPIRDAALERRLTALRRAWLAEPLAGESATFPALAELRCALACQCFINEYVFACDEEAADVDTLRERVCVAVRAGRDVPAEWIVTIASYGALHELDVAERLLGREWAPPMAALIEQQIREPLAERYLRSTIPSLTRIDDVTSRRVAGQYESNPYPRWARVPRVPVQDPFPAWLRRRFPRSELAPLARDAPLEMLVAGCGTGQESIELAQSFPSARLLAIDLSVASLAYARRHSKALGLANVDYAQADLLELPAQPRRFDVISAVGVLHHLADPARGLCALCEVLRPGGAMRLGFYSARARVDLAAARERIALRGDAADAEGIRLCRQALFGDAAYEAVTSRADFWTTSAFRDLLFHVEEHDTDLPALRALLAQHGLRVVGVLLEPRVVRAYVQRFPDDPAAIDLDHWHAWEQDHPATFAGMYRLWVQKP